MAHVGTCPDAAEDTRSRIYGDKECTGGYLLIICR